MLMGEIPNSKRKHNSTPDYYVNDDGSVTKRGAAKPRPQTSSFTINEDGSVTKRITQQRSSQSATHTRKVSPVIQEDRHGTSSSVVSIGTIIWIIATIIFFILLIINTYEENETIGDWILILIGLSFFSGFIYSIIVRPILNWLDNIL